MPDSVDGHCLGQGKAAALKKLATDSEDRCRINGRCHYLAANSFYMRGRMVGVPLTLATGLMGTTLYAGFSKGEKTNSVVVVAMVIASTLLSSLHTSLSYPERSDRHKAAGANYSAMRREFELLAAQCQAAKSDEDYGKVLETMKALNERLTEVAKDSPWFDDKYRVQVDIEDRARDAGEPIVTRGFFRRVVDYLRHCLQKIGFLGKSIYPFQRRAKKPAAPDDPA